MNCTKFLNGDAILDVFHVDLYGPNVIVWGWFDILPSGHVHTIILILKCMKFWPFIQTIPVLLARSFPNPFQHYLILVWTRKMYLVYVSCHETRLKWLTHAHFKRLTSVNNT